MLRPTASESDNYRKNVREKSETIINELLTFGNELFETLFPKAKIISTKNDMSTHWPTDAVLSYKSNELKKIVSGIFDIIEKTCQNKEQELPAFPVSLPRKIGEIVIEASLKMQTYGRDLTDLDYYLLHDLGKAFQLTSAEVYNRIEQILYEIRKQLFRQLKDQLSSLQKEICAWLMLRAIRADNKVHPAEIKYFEIVTELLDNDQTKLELIESRSFELERHLPMVLTDDTAEFLFKYLVEIVMCDKDYDPDETQFIKDIANAFDFDTDQQDRILQPVASSLMVKTNLFQ